MPDPFLDDCGGWTPAPDILTKRYGFESAYLWGRLRRLCQLGKGTYTISPEALGKRFGMSRRTVIDRLKKMIRDGYIEDLTPGVRNKAHTYSVKQGEAKILSGMQISHTESDMLLEDNEVVEPEGTDVGMRNLHSDDAEIAHPDDAGMQELPSRYAKNAHPGMQNLHLNRESLETLKETQDSSPNGEEGDKSPPPRVEPLPVTENEQPIPADPPPETKPKRVRAPKPPAFQVYVEKTEYYSVTKEWVEKIAQIVGDKPEDLIRWGDTITTFTGRGKWKGNVQDMLDWYQNGIPDYSKKANTNGHNQNQTTNQTRTPAQGHSAATGTDKAEQNGGLSEVSAKLGAALRAQARGGRDPT